MHEWIRSSFCSGGDCIELTKLSNGLLAVRDSKNPGIALVFTQAEMSAFFDGINAGDFEHLVDDYVTGEAATYGHTCAHGIAFTSDMRDAIHAAHANNQLAAVCPDCCELIVFPLEIIGPPPAYENDFDLMNRIIAEHRSSHV